MDGSGQFDRLRILPKGSDPTGSGSVSLKLWIQSNTLNLDLDPDPEFWPNLNPDPGQDSDLYPGLCTGTGNQF